jgi:hypothetical protein
VALNCAEDDPARIVTADGTFRTEGELLFSRTATLATGPEELVATGFVSATVQVTVLFPGAVDGLHVTEDSTGGPAVRVNGALAVEPFHEAPSDTAVVTLTLAALAVNEPVEAPAAIVTEAGTATTALFVEICTAAPLTGAGCESATVQDDVPGVTKVEGVQVREETTPGTVTAIEPGDAVVGIDVPTPQDVTVPATLRGTGVLEGAAANCTVTLATVPLGIVFAFIPTRTHVIEPLCGAQVRVFPALVADVPAVSVTALTSAGA